MTRKPATFFLAASLVLAAIGLGACDSSSDVDETALRASAFSKVEFSEEMAHRVIDDYFYTENFRLEKVEITGPGTIQVSINFGPVHDDRMLLLRAAAVSYAYSRILFAHPETERLILVQSGARAPRGARAEPLEPAIITELRRPVAEMVNWERMERAITLDREFEPVLELFTLRYIDPTLQKMLSARLFATMKSSEGRDEDDDVAPPTTEPEPEAPGGR